MMQEDQQDRGDIADKGTYNQDQDYIGDPSGGQLQSDGTPRVQHQGTVTQSMTDGGIGLGNSGIMPEQTDDQNIQDPAISEDDVHSADNTQTVPTKDEADSLANQSDQSTPSQQQLDALHDNPQQIIPPGNTEDEVNDDEDDAGITKADMVDGGD